MEKDSYITVDKDPNWKLENVYDTFLMVQHNNNNKMRITNWNVT